VMGASHGLDPDQTLTGQIAALKAAAADRPQLAKLMAVLQPGDVVAVTNLDRLGKVDPGTARPNQQDRQSRRFVPFALQSALGHRQLAGPAAINLARSHRRVRARTD